MPQGREEFLRRLGHDPANPSRLLTTPTSDVLPDIAARARVPVYRDLPEDTETAAEYHESGGPGRFYSPDISIYGQNLGPWTPGANQVMAHEIGHSLWFNSTNPEEQARWNVLHAQLMKHPSATKDDPFHRYSDDPSHSFAEVYGRYVTSPEWLKTHYPAAYDFFKKKLGFEYSRKIGAK